jgi:hypothetical protein
LLRNHAFFTLRRRRLRRTRRNPVRGSVADAQNQYQLKSEDITQLQGVTVSEIGAVWVTVPEVAVIVIA